MRIVIDMQGAQTESRFRGIGRYTLSFAQGIARNRGEHEVILALNGLFPDTVEPISAAFDGLLQKENIRIWQAPGPVRECDPSNEQRRNVAEIVREAFLASLAPDVIHVSSLFEGYVDDAVTSIGCFDRTTLVSASLYDLIPLLNPDQYLTPSPCYAEYYQRKVAYLKKAAIHLAISEFTRQEGLTHLDMHESRVVNVATAIEPCFRSIPGIEGDAASQLRKKFGLNRPFIFYTGGADERKNLPRLVQAFAALPTGLRAGHQLLLAGKMSVGDVAHLRHLAKAAGLKPDELRFTGYVTDDELVQLYNLCGLFVFPSWHEGFGLPALEAMACGAVVIGAKTSSLPEIIALDDALFDPFDVAAIATKMTRALEDALFRDMLREHGLRQAERFSWDESATRAIRAWEQLQSSRGPEIKASARSWAAIRERLGAIYQDCISNIATVAGAAKALQDTDLLQIAVALEKNERQLDSFLRSATLPEQITWRIEGPFDSSYSLALVNRETARALARLGHNVALHSTEGPGDFPANAKFLADNPDLAEMHDRTTEVTQAAADLTSRNLYPPRVIDMQSRFNFLHAYGWEESGFPLEWVESFNLALQGMTVMSEHVRKIMIDNGVAVPLAVSGIGVDHWERIAADTQFVLKARKFRFLHVSSCFPRKGAVEMLRAYGRAFRASDDVTLVIKTFPNPHNEIHRWLVEARAGDPDFPYVQILEGDCSDAELKALYQQCHALVAPSRAEGFGLPMAEAMLSGLAVITTGWSGQIDFCTSETAWLIDYSFEPADTHFGLFSSVWAAPDVAHLAQVMREVYETPQEVRGLRASAGRKLLLERHCWSDVAARMVEAARSWSHMPEIPEPRIGWVTTWNTRCGVATYSEHLIRGMPCQVKILAARTDTPACEEQANVDRCWVAGDRDPLVDLRRSIEISGLDTLVIQFNYGFFDLQVLATFLAEQIDAGRVVVVLMHSTTDPTHVPHKKLTTLVPVLSRCHRVLVHAPGDLNRLKQHGLVENVALFPHGILEYSAPVKGAGGSDDGFVVASYGFFLPHKGLLELIDAIALLRAEGMQIRLHMVNAEYPAPESTRLIEQAKKKAASIGLEGVVTFVTEYLADSESLARLAAADLIVFPYQDTGESASGAVRYGIASGAPVAVTPLSIFDDVRAAVHYLPGLSPENIAKGIADLLQNLAEGKESVTEQSESAERWRAAHRYPLISQRLYGILVAIRRLSRDQQRTSAF
jgi:O-antigen biosynthesis alpha-1,2-mannosyltransferase